MGQPIDAHFGRPDGDYGLNRPLHPVNDARREIFGHAVLPLQREAKFDRVETFGFQLVQLLDDFIGLSGDAKGVDYFRCHKACFVRFPLATRLSGSRPDAIRVRVSSMVKAPPKVLASPALEGTHPDHLQLGC